MNGLYVFARSRAGRRTIDRSVGRVVPRYGVAARALTEWRQGGDLTAQVSTVFLGIDHSFMSDPHTPILFETMIFAVALPVLDEYQERYSAWDTALAGHQRAVAEVTTLLGPPIDDGES